MAEFNDSIYQTVNLTDGDLYTYTVIIGQISEDKSDALELWYGGEFVAELAGSDAGPITTTGTFIASNIGKGSDFELRPSGAINVSVLSVSLQRVMVTERIADTPVADFLVGNDDYGDEIFFRADTHPMVLNDKFEMFANPLAVITKLQRGTLVKCFVALDDGHFYQLEGNATKGVSIVKVNSQERGVIVTPPIAREFSISWRESSKQRCRITQGGVVFLPTAMNIVE